MSEKTNFYVHPTSVVDSGARLGKGTKIWHFSHIFSRAVIGERCVFGQNTMVSNGVTIGNNVKVQNNVAIYEGTTIEDDVFLGPSCVLTNVSNPRSQVVRQSLYEPTIIRRGATVGANATLVCGITLGQYCFVAAGTVVVGDVPDYAMLMGVPGKQTGWMSRHGHKLSFDPTTNEATCPEAKLRYRLNRAEDKATVQCIDLDEAEALPDSLSLGSKSYREFKNE